jgi:hypothetical protein
MGRTAASFAVLVLVVLGTARSAEAAKIPIIYQTGQDTFESGPLPAPFDKEPALAGAYAGYVCDITGVFWSYFSIDNCRAAAIRGNQFDDSPELAAAIKAKYPEPTIPFWADHGWKLMIGAVGAIVLAGFLLGRRKTGEEPVLRNSVPPKTQFHLAVDAAAAEDHRAAFERPSQPAQPMQPMQPLQPMQGMQPPMHQQPPMMPPSYAAAPEQPTTQYPPHFNPQQYAQQPSPFAPPPMQQPPMQQPPMQQPPMQAMPQPPVPQQPMAQQLYQPMVMPPVQQRPTSNQHTQIGYIVQQPPKVGGTPAPVLQQPPKVAVAPQAYGQMPYGEDGPTIAEPMTQEMMEQLHEQMRRVARGSTSTPKPQRAPSHLPSDEQPTTPAPSPAVRAAQVPAGGWTAPTIVSRPRNK